MAFEMPCTNRERLGLAFAMRVHADRDANQSAPLRLLRGLVGQPPEPVDLLVGGDALTGRDGDVAAGAVGLAEAALDAAIDLQLGRGGWWLLVTVEDSLGAEVCGRQVRAGAVGLAEAALHAAVDLHPWEGDGGWWWLKMVRGGLHEAGVEEHGKRVRVGWGSWTRRSCT